MSTVSTWLYKLCTQAAILLSQRQLLPQCWAKSPWPGEGQFPPALYRGGNALKLSILHSPPKRVALNRLSALAGLTSDVSSPKDWSLLPKITGNRLLYNHMVWPKMETDSSNAHHVTKQRQLKKHDKKLRGKADVLSNFDGLMMQYMIYYYISLSYGITPQNKDDYRNITRS